MFLAALQDIPPELQEAAQIDGANAWQRFLHVTLPLLRPVAILVVTLGIIGSMKVFGPMFIMTQGGPAGASKSIIYHLYTEAFQRMRMGYASALGWVLLMIVLALTYAQFRLSGRWVYYAGEMEQS